ncbi:MAG: SusC/RagA family TonB-linked outer membrane protein, partial [Bacteroidaceae bacterium]|nr:SusC/RagA family TonB-linked outer membrane protein [Bacteroidaceae bacterium]
VEGGDDIGMYALSLGFSKSKGTANGDDMSRLNLRFNTDIKIASILKTGLDISYNQNSYNVLDNGWSEDYSMQNIGSTNVLGLIMPSFINPYSYYFDQELLKTSTYGSDAAVLSNEYAGKYAKDNTTNYINNPFYFPKTIGPNGGINEVLRNPYWIIANGRGETKNFAQTTQINLNVSPKLQVTKTFTITDHFNFNMMRNSEKYYLPVNGSTPYNLTDLGSITSVLKTMFAKETTIQNDLRLDWRNTYGAHFINVFGGWRFDSYSYSYNYMRGYENDNDKLIYLDKNMKYLNYGGSNDNWKEMIYYLDANYNYKNRYFADFTLSVQSSSRFGKNTNSGFQMCGLSWAVFPSLQLGWLISNEKWFQAGKGVQYLKLTAGVEQSGNDDLDYYASRTYWESQYVTHNMVGLYLNNIENSKIQWETTTKYNVALEGSFLNNRLSARLDLFWHNTTNLLTRRELDYLSGLASYWTNDGALTNKGFEASINAALINKKDWKWELGASMGHYNNKVTQLPSSDVIELERYDWAIGGYVKTGQTINGFTNSVYGDKNVLTAVGSALGSFYGWQTQTGKNGSIVFADEAEASTATTASPDGHLKYNTNAGGMVNFKSGDVHFVDQNGDGVIDDNDKVVIGNPNPDIFGNIFTSLTWKDLRLDVFFKYSLGNDVYNYQRSVIEGLNTTYNQSPAATRRWTYEGQVTDLPRACYTNSEDWRNNERMSDRWIEDGSFLKLKNVRLTYKIPYRNNWLLGLKVWGEANNLFTLTRYLGTDPEMSCRNNAMYQGIDTGMIPAGRSFNMGVTINL